ncbi:helix-turn-helix domain-containing protein [Helicobacter pylori]|nr:helix-turn-helix domain-containing protein [Helicobacter pylori]WQZ68995.1 helix-turn-helix domain-containing protein [Helicobacter pylori]WQZ69174.1 helix-turn-helix domain-containing protein [Helicobacter pylori]
MKVNKGFKFRLYPTKEQQDKLQHCFLSIIKLIILA